MKRFNTIVAMASLLVAAVPAVAQIQLPQPGKQPIYTITINVVDRTTKAVNYSHRGGSTTIDFKGTALLPNARGEAKVESKQGYMEVEVEFDDLQSATRFGPEFLTYVLWAITPEGRATNMGEVILNGTKSKLDVTTELQAFGLIVTAEPYFAVSQPSDVVVMENAIRKDTVGKVEEIEAKYQLLPRGQYTINVLPADLKPIPLDKDTPLDLYEARNAVRIAKWAGAGTSAAESFDKATRLLAQAEAFKTSKAGTKSIAMAAREAVQTAEDARLITLKNQADERLAMERAASAGREATANAAAANARAVASEADRARAAAEVQANRERLEASEATRRAAEGARVLAERVKAEADLAAERAARDRQAADLAAQQAARDRQAADLVAQQAARDRQVADLAAQQAARDKQAAEAATLQTLRNAEAQADREKQELRNKLAAQLNTILQTRDSAKGLIANLPDVLFDTGQYSLKAGAREVLARLSGIVLAYPSLMLDVSGYTDNVGTDQLNQTLSENRAASVRNFLITQGIVRTSIASQGFGETQPIATNDTAAGRQQNRRVELVVSGESIGTTTTTIELRPLN
jgi:outer membrane protein OmpA-like peptidoglycan-associated protein